MPKQTRSSLFANTNHAFLSQHLNFFPDQILKDRPGNQASRSETKRGDFLAFYRLVNKAARNAKNFCRLGDSERQAIRIVGRLHTVRIEISVLALNGQMYLAKRNCQL